MISLLIVLVLNIQIEKAFAWTYYGTWWMGGDVESESPGNARIIYTYPDTVQTGKPFNVGVTLEYLKDNTARSNWVVFSNVSVNMRSLPVLPGKPNLINLLNNTEHRTSELIEPGDRYSHSFNLIAPKYPGKYILTLTFNAFFGPGSGGVGIFQFDTGTYYNQTDREHGIILPEGFQEAPPIIVEQDEVSKQRLLNIEFESPYNEIGPVNVTVDNKDHSIINKVHLQLPIDSSHTVTAPKIINMVKDKANEKQYSVRAVFVEWSDGLKNNSRIVTMDRNVDLFALYKSQYTLTASSEIGNVGVGGYAEVSHNKDVFWFNSGSQAQYAINSLSGFWILPIPKSFDRWVGDISGDTAGIPAGHLTMDGPKSIRAEWKDDFTYLSIITGSYIGVAVTTIEILFNQKKIREFIGNRMSKNRARKGNRNK